MISMIKVKCRPVPPLGEGTSGTWQIKACQVCEQIARKPRKAPIPPQIRILQEARGSGFCTSELAAMSLVKVTRGIERKDSHGHDSQEVPLR